MKKTVLLCLFAVAAMAGTNAQTISVVTPDGSTSIYTDLNLAIQDAAAGSTLYLSGGGFQVNDTTKITKKLTIIGIGHRPDNDNADGNTNVSGNFFFESGSNYSSLMGVYLSGNVNIGNAEGAMNNFLLRYCNVNSIQVGNSNCQGVVINQNYLRGVSNGGNNAIIFSNNVLNAIYFMIGGIIEHNIIHGQLGESWWEYGFNERGVVQNTLIKNNIFFNWGASVASGSMLANNMSVQLLGDAVNAVVVENWENVFEGNYTGVNATDNYRLKPGAPGKNAGTDGSDIGIYGGTGFSDSALPPIPRITSKNIADQTDSDGKLRVNITVKAGE